MPKPHVRRIEERQHPMLGKVFLAVCSCGWSGTVSRIRVRAARCWRAHAERSAA